MIFVAIIVGGPIFISAAAFAAALGYLNVYIIFSLAFFGELAVDVVLYFIGRMRAGLKARSGARLGSRPLIGILRLCVKIWEVS